MLKASWIPTPLVPVDGRPPVALHPATPPSRLRGAYIAGQFVLLALSLVMLAIGRRGADRMAVRVREVLERLGGLWIKAGQVIALRIDLLPAVLARELSRLQSRAVGFPGEVARRIVEDELGGPIEAVFDEWGHEPVAAASIGQVHRARLRREGVWVAVKVQKPFSADLFARDLRAIEWIVRTVERLGLFPHMKWQEGLHEIRQIMGEELDFGYEASSTRRMRKALKRHRVYVPKVFGRYSTARVLVTEYLDMVLMVDYLRVAREDPERARHWCDENQVEPRRVATRLVLSFQRQMLEENLYHGDLHPGNIALLRGSRVALIDFGTTNFTEAEYLWKFRTLMRTMASGEFARCADMALMLCGRLPSIDLAAVHAQLVRVLQSWGTRTFVRELPFHDKSVGNLTNEMMQVLLGSRCTMDWAWLRLHRATSTLDASLMELAPEINYRRITARTFARIDRRRLGRALGAAGVRRAVIAVDSAARQPAMLAEYVAAQTALIRRQARVFRGVSDRATAAVAGLLAVGRGAVALQALFVLALVASGGWVAAGTLRFAPPFAGLDSSPAPDGRTLVVLLGLDAWAWFALTRLRRAIGHGGLSLNQRLVAS